ncbi:MAG: LysR family transcriptional regulator [Pyramidobacter sp.]|nr:LysR family transcriptional regulator [Pyramidobacter sp.]
MDMNDLRLFLDVWKSGSITRAANSHFITQSATSKRILLLEKELGVSLFERGKGKPQVKLTPAGKNFSDIAERILTLYSQALELRRNPELSYLTVACINSVQNYLLPPMVVELERKFPRLCITLEDHHTAEILSLVEDQRVDIGIAHSPSNHPDLRSELLYEEEYRAVMRDSSHNRGKKTVLHPSELRPGNEVFEAFGADFQEWHDQWWDISSAKIRVNVTPTAEQYLRGSHDWIILPAAVARAMEKKGFVSYTLDPSPPRHSVYVIYHVKNSNKFIKSFVDEAITYFAPLAAQGTPGK